MELKAKHALNLNRVLAVTGGKGGIGKTNIAINLSIALSLMSQKVMLLDADFGLANVDVLLNLQSNGNLVDLMLNEYSLDDIILHGPNNIKIIPASSGSQDLVAMDHLQLYGLVEKIAHYPDKPDVLVIDTAAGISNSVIGLTITSDEIIVVICNEPASIADAYALIKLLNRQHKINKFRIIANKVRSKEESQEVFAKLTKVADKFLDVSLCLIGAIPMDKYIERSILKRKAVVCCYPNSKAAMAFFDIAKKILSWPRDNHLPGKMCFYQQNVVSGIS